MVFFPITIIVVILIYLARKPRAAAAPIKLSRRTHFIILTGFIALLLLFTIIAELMEPHRAIESPFSTTTPFNEEDRLNLETIIINGEPVPPSLLIERRTHPAGKSLTIERSHSPYEGPYVYVERKSGEDQTIEEVLYKPYLSINNYDFSDFINVEKPIWKDGVVLLQANTSSQLSFVSFYDANLLNQLTKSDFKYNHGYSSTERALVMHLIVPEDLEVIDTHGDESIFFID